MAFFKVSTNEEAIKDFNGSEGYINKSGMFDVIIKHAVVNVSPNGSQYIDLYIEHEGKFQPIFQAIRITNNDGSKNINQNLLNKLCLIIGGEAGTEINDPVSMMLPIGKGGEQQEAMVLDDFTDQAVGMRIQMEYSLYDGKIRERKNIRNVFRIPDHATASEIVNNAEFGVQYAKEAESADKISYKDGLSEEDVQNWIKERRSGNKPEPAKKPVTFGAKKTFAKK